MAIRFHNPACLRIPLLACIASLWLLVMLPHDGSAQAAPDFTVSVHPFTSCATDAPITGTVTLANLPTGSEFAVQLLRDGRVLDRQLVEGIGGITDGQRQWSVTGDAGTSYKSLELSFALYDDERILVRDEAITLNPDCDADRASPESPPASPVTTMPPAIRERATPSLVNPDLDGERDVALVAGFAGATVLVLTALAFLDRRPEP